MEDMTDEDLHQDERPAYEAPRFEVISLSCEISAYAPDDEPLF